MTPQSGKTAMEPAPKVIPLQFCLHNFEASPIPAWVGVSIRIDGVDNEVALTGTEVERIVETSRLSSKNFGTAPVV